MSFFLTLDDEFVNEQNKWVTLDNILEGTHPGYAPQTVTFYFGKELSYKNVSRPCVDLSKFANKKDAGIISQDNITVTEVLEAGTYFTIGPKGSLSYDQNRVYKVDCDCRVQVITRYVSFQYFFTVDVQFVHNQDTTGQEYAKVSLYTVGYNPPPAIPSTITIPDTIYGGEDAKISWSAATDPDGNLDGYIVERSYNGGSSWSQIYQGRSTSTTTTIPFGTETVMFRVCAYDTYGEKSSWTTSPNRVVINNHAPTAPPSISVPLSPSGGDKLTITWTASTDADNNLAGYALERQWDGAGSFEQIFKGNALSYQDTIPKGERTSVIYRVRAYDTLDAYSTYTTAPSRTIDNNTAPVITSDLSGDLGEKSEGFSIPYTVSDAEQQEVTVVEKVGDLVKRTYKATLDQQNTFEVTGEYFQRILNGAQTVQIMATDSAGKSSILQLTFTKKVHKAVITLSEPLAVEEQITVAVLSITGDIPADATQLIELTNNGNDPEPVWEDATADVKAGRNHPFTNKTQTNGWAFNFRVTVERGESGEDGNIVSIQGGFQ